MAGRKVSDAELPRLGAAHVNRIRKRYIKHTYMYVYMDRCVCVYLDTYIGKYIDTCMYMEG